MKLKRNVGRLFSIMAALVLILSLIPQTASAQAYDPKEGYKDLGIRFWEDKQPEVGFYINASSRYILETVKEPSMGSLFGEWSVMDLLRGKYTGYDYMNYIPENYFEDYLGRIEQYVADKNGDLDRNKSTEWSRLILALSSLGYDIKNVNGYDFIGKLSESHRFSYRQGINGPIWEIIAMNTGAYNFYPNATNTDVNTYGKMIDYILKLEITQVNGVKGGWALAGKVPDPDITGMALQAFAAYYGHKEKYELTGASATYGEFVQAVERAVSVLASIQNKNGAYFAWGNTNAESTTQVIVALTALGIDPLQEKVTLPAIGQEVRFIKEGAVQDGVNTNNMIDALITFWAWGSGSSPEVSGFKHVTAGYDGGGGSGTGVNAMATDQALYGLIAYDRFKKGEKSLYDMTDMTNGEYKNMLAKKHQVTLIGNQGVEVKQDTYTPYQVFEIPQGVDVTGKVFKEWNSKKDGSGASYAHGEKLSMPDQNITLFAQYQNSVYNITFETGGATFVGTEIPKTFTVDDGEITLPTAAQLNYDGYNFEGWYKDQSFSGEPVTAIVGGSIGDKTFYAKWVGEEEIDQKKANEVEDLIAALPEASALKLDDEASITAARGAYSSLTKMQQSLVKNLGKLVELETRMVAIKQEAADKTAAQKVEDLIAALPEASVLKLDNEASITSARGAYSSLTKTQQSLVKNLGKLVELETRMAALKQEAADKVAAQKVEGLIMTLPEASALTLADKPAVAAVRKAFDQLTEAQKKLVENQEKLVGLESKIAVLEAKPADQNTPNSKPDHQTDPVKDGTGQKSSDSTKDPVKSENTHYPKTGDSTNLWVSVLGSALIAAGLIMMTITRRRKTVKSAN